MVLYIYKTIIGLVPNPGLKIEFSMRTKTRGPRLHNKLPPEMRDLENTSAPTNKYFDKFKTRLDQFLSKIPDQPGGATSNSLLGRV